MDKNSEKDNEKLKIYINVEPLGLKFGAVFKKSETFQAPVNFVQSQIKKLDIKFEVGRIVEDKTSAIILTDFLLGDFLANNDQITIFSEEYGFIKESLPGNNEHSSSKKNFYLRSVSDLYKTKNFLKKKRKDKQKPKKENNLQKKKEEKEENDEESVKDNEKNKNKNNKKNKKDDGKKEKENEKEKEKEKEKDKEKDKESGKKLKLEKKYQKNEDKNPKISKKSNQKKEVLSSESEEENEKEE